ncbi:hypothetical protein GCK72_006729 [Caenorhabditis remanei]|uniref:Serpentine receptor class gamma n=1 Tax=Caenorhabditis remanei TaxID=31234 RepID=A0A6A5HI38_CAERE|nr:hypothetical protein GCK72_006729 [Caenorhabditis remanei]KAF1766771.1 hypothetical protein GCK72_006729 [Caenorhabditis remanei]
MNHCRFAKSLAQIFMVLNRMSCVLIPADYEIMWKKLTPISRFIIALLPFSGTWNIWISRVYSFRTPSGGFAMDYIKNVSWAALSLFQSIFVLTALGFTIICTSITLFKLIVLPDRIKSAEKSLCFTSIFISCCFLIVGATQVAFVTCTVCRSFEYLYFMYMLSYWTFDVFNVGTAVVMILTNKQLRDSIFHFKEKDTNGTASVSAAPQNDNKADNIWEQRT